jgi:hypothetical protein
VRANNKSKFRLAIFSLRTKFFAAHHSRAGGNIVFTAPTLILTGACHRADGAGIIKKKSFKNINKKFKIIYYKKYV